LEIKHKLMNRAMGWILIVLGAASLLETRRIIYGLGTGGLVGDHTFPFLLGAFFLILGVYFQFTTQIASIDFPQGTVLRRMIFSALLLIVYWQTIPLLGYTLGTHLVSAALFFVIGGYKWYLSFIFGAATAVILHLIFRVWLYLPFPAGFLGI